MALEPKDTLETAMHEKLRRLPELSAPATLLPRVMAAVRARAALPWWRRSWWEWPIAARTVFTGLVTASVALLIYFGSPLLTGLTTTASASVPSHWLATITDFVKGLESVANAGAVVWRAAAQPVILGLLVISSAMYLLCVGAGTMFVRLALRRI